MIDGVCVCVFVQAASQTSLLTDDDMDEEVDEDVQTEEDQLIDGSLMTILW